VPLGARPCITPDDAAKGIKIPFLLYNCVVEHCSHNELDRMTKQKKQNQKTEGG